jgi:enterochelin esterase-like enzyme
MSPAGFHTAGGRRSGTAGAGSRLGVRPLKTIRKARAGASGQGPCRGPAGRGNVWIDPVKDEPAGTNYRLYSTPSRGPDTQASYLVYLPPDYETARNRRHPVLYWLHGGGGNQRQGGWMVEKLDGKIRSGEIPPFLVIVPQALPDVRYINAKDGTRSLEDVIIKDLIPHVDAAYRTIATREARAVEGFSMGGFGSLRLGFKFPDLFGTVSALEPSITEMKDELEIVTEPFGNDQAFYDAAGPWTIVKEHSGSIRARTTVRLLVGDQDKLFPLVRQYSELLTSLRIDRQYAVAPGAPHQYEQIVAGAPFDARVFWKAAFAKAR